MKLAPFRFGIGTLAPLICAGLLAALLVVGGIDARRPSGALEYLARAARAIDAIPYKVGSAVGIDREATPAAVKLLTPNKILERRYVDTRTGAAMVLLIVHCSDVRDMIGHYPPVCYPAHGWHQGRVEPVALEIDEPGASAMRYEFTKTEDVIQQRMTVLDFFVIPGEGATVFPDMKDVERASRSTQAGGLGVAQVQIVTGGDVTPDARDQAVREMLRAIGPALRTIGEGTKP
jgi:hypothetical protein